MHTLGLSDSSNITIMIVHNMQYTIKKFNLCYQSDTVYMYSSSSQWCK